MFGVCTIDGERSDIKAFDDLQTANNFARQQAKTYDNVKVYSIPAARAPAAVKAAIEMGNGELIYVPPHEPSPQEAKEAQKRYIEYVYKDLFE